METTSAFCVPIRQLDRGDQRLSWPISADWLAQQLAGTEARSAGDNGTLELYLTKDKGRILVKGHAAVAVELDCARTLEPFRLDVKAPILLLLSPQPAERREGDRRQRSPKTGAAGGRAARGKEAELDSLLSAEDAAEDHYSGDTLELDPFVREHILLELPLFPVRSGLPSEPTRATDTGFDAAGATVAPVLDPRLAPLEAIARGLRGKD